jgi:putative Mg2+ transporter-C (MgtC) family protein
VPFEAIIVSTDLSFQLDISLRLLAAALFGAILGLEREVHGHPAGMRTHMLVCVGSALFTVLSVYGFSSPGGPLTGDPSRVAAQIVTGIGFLGAGAILKDGANVRGLTTAASLWLVASIGLAAGVGAYFPAAAGCAIGLLALWPIHLLVQKLDLSGGRTLRLHLGLRKLDVFASVSQVLLSNRVEIVNVSSAKTKAGHTMDIEVRLPSGGLSHRILTELEKLPGVEVETITQAEEA